MDKRELMRLALDARKGAYAPYSGFCVGAALLTKQGRVYTGCNIENAAYTPSNCAERTAFFKAVSEGERDFSMIAVAGGPRDAEALLPCAPCGVCRQVMMEFCAPAEFLVVLGASPDDCAGYTLGQLLPLGFGGENLKK